MSLLEQILKERPKFHKGETEIKREFSAEESLLDRHYVEKLARRESICWGIDEEVARFIYNSVNQESRTLETGAGLSTLMFGLKGSKHVVITPNDAEVLAIKEYAEKMKINVDNITFVASESEKYLPRLNSLELDLVFIDGKHAFPWPIIDWFYTADRLKKGGLMIIDDVHIHPIAILRDFMKEDPRWKFVRSFEKRTDVFEKTSDSVHDVAWHMQPYLYKRLSKESRIEKVWGKLRRFVSDRFKKIKNNV